MNLASLLDSSVVKIPLESATSEEAIAELLELLVRAGRIKDREGALEALYQREAKGSTGIGGGVAIPHARSPEVGTLALAVGVSRAGIEFDAVDDKPVHLVFLLIAAPDKPGLNVETLADIGRLGQIAGVFQRLLSARDASELIRIIQEAQLQ